MLPSSRHLEKNEGKNGADLHCGTMIVHLHSSFNTFLTQREMRRGGGTNQLFSPTQVCAKASMPGVPGHRYLELNDAHFVL